MTDRIDHAHIMISTPCQSGKIDINCHISLLLAAQELIKNNISYTLDYSMGSSIDAARSRMASNFLKSDCTHLFFVDDDMAFSADLIIRMLIENVDIVGVPYRRKKREVKYNLRHSEKVKSISDRPYMIEVEAIATGLMMIKRGVFEKLKDKVPKYFTEKGAEVEYLFFRHEIVYDKTVGGTAYMSEDYNFCRLARQEGFAIWGYIDEPVAHIGPYAYDGSYAEHIKTEEQVSFTTDRLRLPLRILLQ